VLAYRLAILAEEATPAATSDKENLYPHLAELLVGLVAFFVIFFFFWKWVLPQAKRVLEERRKQIQGQLESAEQTRQQADQELADYRAQLANAREEGNRIIEEARKTAEQLRRDVQANAEQEAQNTVTRAQEEIRAERDRVFNELRSQVAALAVDVAGRVVGRSLDAKAHEQLIDDYIDQVASGEKGQN
jgi:F-type H+-transporting ATPase subunit b